VCGDGVAIDVNEWVGGGAGGEGVMRNGEPARHLIYIFTVPSDHEHLTGPPGRFGNSAYTLHSSGVCQSALR